MKKSILFIKTLVLVGALLMFSCNNDDGVSCPEPLIGELDASETEFAGTWEFTAMVAEEAIDITDDKTDNPSTDIYAQFPECQQDLTYTFAKNRDYVQKQGFLADECQNKQSVSGTWKLTADTLTFVAICATQSIKIDVNEAGDAFSYTAILNFQDAKAGLKTTKVTFTYSKVSEGGE